MGDATQVLTSENSAEFYAQKLGLDTAKPDAPAAEDPAAKADAKADTPQGEPEQVDVEKPDGEGEQTEEHKDGRLKKRFSELTAKRREADARAAAAEAKAAALEAELQQQRTPKGSPPAGGVPPAGRAPPAGLAGEPQPHQFQDVFEYQKAVAVWAAEQVQSERDQERAQKEAQTAEQTRIEAAIRRQDEYRTTVADYDEVVDAAADAGVMISNVVREAMLDSEFYPQILYHLASHVDEARAIAKMSPVQAVRAIGKLEAKFDAAPAAPVKAVEVSRAPAPISPLKGGNAKPAVPINGDGEFVGDYQTWKAMRKSGKIK